MSAQFILEYAGAPVRFGIAGATLCQEWEADRFISEADVWLAAHRAGLLTARCRVVNLYERNGLDGLQGAQGAQGTQWTNRPANNFIK